MTSLTPHIRVLRAESEALTEQARLATDEAAAAIDKGQTSGATMHSTVALILVRTSEAKQQAADALEAEERALYEKAMRK